MVATIGCIFSRMTQNPLTAPAGPQRRRDGDAKHHADNARFGRRPTDRSAPMPSQNMKMPVMAMMKQEFRLIRFNAVRNREPHMQRR